MRLIPASQVEPDAQAVRVPPLLIEQRQEPHRVLDFDVETIAAGFADPDWVPQKITCVAWSWVGSDKVQSAVCTAAGLFGCPERRALMLKPLLRAIAEATMLTGHNIAKFDLPIVNA